GATGCGPPAAPDGSRSRGSGCAARRAPPSPRRLGYDPSLPPVRDPSGRLAGGCDQPNEPCWVRRQEHPRRRRYASGMPDPIASPAALPVPPAGPLLVPTGIGIAAATAAVTWAVLEAAPGVVVAAGSCGGLAADVEVGTLIVGESFTYSIADATAFGYAPGQVPGGPVRFEAAPAWVDAAEQAALRADGRGEGHGVRRGLMLSGDAFVTADLAAPMR